MFLKDIKVTEYNSFYQGYIDCLNLETQLLDGFKKGKLDLISFFNAIPSEKQGFSYASGKWTIKEALQHIIDTERVFMYRCFRIARNDQMPLAGFEQNQYISPSAANSKSMEALLKEYSIGRDAFVNLLESLTNDDLACSGTASDHTISARAMAFITLGHEKHHLKIVKERYL